ncbi:MAG: PAS domain-containing protein [Leptolyngbya sp.]|nr:PAS domain-containing protein [Candidatus Melainabacteria bacterium]
MNGNDYLEPEILAARLTAEEIVKRKQWLEFESIDPELVRDIDEIMEESIDELMDSMYQHFLSFEETRSFFPNERIIQYAREAQKQYFLRLAKGAYDDDYVNDRLRVGSTHHRIELDPKWYIGAYNRAVSWLLPKLSERSNDDSVKMIEHSKTLMKLIFFDMGLAIESYISVKEQAIKKHRDAIQELETERRVTKSILESSPIGIVSLDDNFICSECNEEFVETMSASNRINVIGKQLFAVAPRLTKEPFITVMHTGLPCRKTAIPLTLTHEIGLEQTYWDLAVWPVKNLDGITTGLVAMFANVTDRVLLQQQREDFVATLTHDLKTPISAANRAVRLMLEGDFGPLNEEQKEILQTMFQSNTTLFGLVQTLLDVYRFDSGVKEMDLKICNLSNTISQLVTEIMPLAKEKKVELRAILPLTTKSVLIDETEIRRVVQNLIDNSLKFTPTDGTILVVLTEEEGRTIVSVEDSGKGISEENMPKLFQRFWQAGSAGRYYASTGLGLYLSRKIIEGHGGRIWCESEFGKGSAFRFSINHG